MKELNTKIGVFLTTYTQKELDKKIWSYIEYDDKDGCAVFMDAIKSFNSESEFYISEEEAIEFTGLEIKSGETHSQDLYTNYKGNPLGLPVNEAQLFFTNPVTSLKSAFEIAAPTFDFNKDFFHVKIAK